MVAGLGAATCGKCNVGELSGSVRVGGGTVVECWWATKARIKCKMAVRAIALAVKKRECDSLVSIAVVEGVWHTGVKWWWH